MASKASSRHEQAASGEVKVIAPDGFMDAAISENILAGVPMRRRGAFQFGPTLQPGPRSHVDSGLGKAIGRGTASLIAPNWLITQPWSAMSSTAWRSSSSSRPRPKHRRR